MISPSAPAGSTRSVAGSTIFKSLNTGRPSVETFKRMSALSSPASERHGRQLRRPVAAKEDAVLEPAIGFFRQRLRDSGTAGEENA